MHALMFYTDFFVAEIRLSYSIGMCLGGDIPVIRPSCTYTLLLVVWQCVLELMAFDTRVFALLGFL